MVCNGILPIDQLRDVIGMMPWYMYEFYIYAFIYVWILWICMNSMYTCCIYSLIYVWILCICFIYAFLYVWIVYLYNTFVCLHIILYVYVIIVCAIIFSLKKYLLFFLGGVLILAIYRAPSHLPQLPLHTCVSPSQERHSKLRTEFTSLLLRLKTCVACESFLSLCIAFS